jgi:hypothetical protein
VTVSRSWVPVRNKANRGCEAESLRRGRRWSRAGRCVDVATTGPTGVYLATGRWVAISVGRLWAGENGADDISLGQACLGASVGTVGSGWGLSEGCVVAALDRGGGPFVNKGRSIEPNQGIDRPRRRGPGVAPGQGVAEPDVKEGNRK